MKFEKYYRFGSPFWFHGIYKIARYNYHKGKPVKPYYVAYQVTASGQWGNYIDPIAQRNAMMTLAEAKALCAKHAETHQPGRYLLNKARKNKFRWLAMDKENNHLTEAA